MQILSNHISALNVCESPKFSRVKENRGRGTRWWRQILDRKWKYDRFAHAQWKIRIIALIYGRIGEIFASFRKSEPRNTMVMSDFSPEVEVRPFRACAMHPVILIGTVRSLWTFLWGRYHVPQLYIRNVAWFLIIPVASLGGGGTTSEVGSSEATTAKNHHFQRRWLKKVVRFI